jgi:tight adherence protein C
MSITPLVALAPIEIGALDAETLEAVRVPALAILWLFAGLAMWILARRWLNTEATRRRVREDETAGAEPDEIELARDQVGRGLSRWLFLAGYRSPSAATTFVTLTLLLSTLGLVGALWIGRSGVIDTLVSSASSVPGGLGDFAAVALYAAPWILLAYAAMLPTLLVRGRRKQLVRDVERDLPITLELLATMSESGLAFDGALGKALEAQQADRPLAVELRTFQFETLTGVARVASFRRLARRLEVTSISIFTSALVQAEQVGSGFAGVLRTQADDLRHRRREQANALAQALPVKLIFPLVLCFLPGIFVTTLGPTFLQFINLADSMSGR